MAKPADFFLDEKKGSYPDFRGPMRAASSIKPLIDGNAIFRDQEEAILRADESVFIATWSFDPLLPVTSGKVPKAVKNWGQLLLGVASEKGIAVQILLTDFDPLLAANFHAQVWSRRAGLVQAADTLGIPKDMFQVMVVRHRAEWTLDPLRERLLQSRYDDLLKLLNAPDGKKGFAKLPGLWDRFDLTGDKFELKKGVSFPVIPGSHHQKVLLVDETVAYAGGINHIADNLEDSTHKQLSPLSWHDGCARVEGSVLEDIIRGTFDLWNDEVPRFNAFVDQSNKLRSEFQLPVRAVSALVPSTDKERSGRIACQSWRTVCQSIDSSGQPVTSATDVIDGYVNAIGHAEKFIYIENQYLREQRLADAMIARLKDVSGLNLVVVLPSISEEKLKKTGDPITQVGVALQHKIIESLKTAFGDKFGVFALFNPKPLPKLIYVHNKVMIIDDAFVTIGSANANPRSFALDTELNIAWYHPASAKALRKKLWQEILGPRSGSDSWSPPSYAKEWTKKAQHNWSVGKDYVKGFVMPYDSDTTGSDNLLIPDWLAQAEESVGGRKIV